MTNKFLLLAAAAGTLAFASCNSEAGGDAMTDEMMQAKIDSAVQSRMEEMQMQLAMQNDSLINAMAMMKADSMMAAAAGSSNAGARRATPTRPTTSTPTETPSSSNDVRTGGFGAKSDQNNANDKNSVQGGGFKSKSDQNRADDKNSMGGGGFKSKADKPKQ